jgi:hypothetical protein
MKGHIQLTSLFISIHIYAGSRDPYNLHGSGAGFSLSWRGNPELLVGVKNSDREIIQIVSESMILAIPE